MPKVSIGLPVYNGDKYLKESLGSLLNQTYGDFEIVISDNASVDKTEDICREYSMLDKRVRYYRNNVNLGYANNFNRVFELSKGPYFKWHAHDDLVDPTFLEKSMMILEDSPDINLVFPGIEYIDEYNKCIRVNNTDYSLTSNDRINRLHQLINYEIDSNDIFWAIYGLTRRELLEKTSLHGKYIAGDQVLLMEIVLHGKIKRIKDILLYVREHPDSSMMKCIFPKERYAWCNTQNTPLIVFPAWNRYYQHYKTIGKFEMGGLSTIKAYYQISRRLFKKDLRTLAGEFKLVAKESILNKIGRQFINKNGSSRNRVGGI